jgi:PAS domain S-box-containing protein
MSARLPHNSKSLLGTLVVVTVVVITAIISSHALVRYVSERSALIDAMQDSVSTSLSRLAQSIGPIMAAYAVGEYQKQIRTEIELKPFEAVVVDDRLMAEIIGRPAYVSGFIKDESGHIVDFDPANNHHARLLASSFFTRSAPVSFDGKQIGSISIYGSNRQLAAKQDEILLYSVTTAVLLSTLLVVTLFLFVQRLVVKPFRLIEQSVSQRDEDGIPMTYLPQFDYRELNDLTDTMNAMLDVVRQSRDNLRWERTRLQNVIDGTRVGTWEWNVQTGETVLNEQWARIAGYSLRELEPISIDTWIKLVHADDLKVSNERLQRHFAGQVDHYECEARVRHKEGHWVWVLDRGQVAKWTDNGQPLLMAGTHQDISERKQHERMLEEANENLEKKVAERTRELELASQAKGEFLANMSHEIRTPMNGILGMAHLIGNGELSEKQRNYLAKLTVSAEHMLHILNDILDFSKIESGMLEIEQAPFTLDQVMTGLQDVIESRLLDRHIDFRIDIDAELPEQLLGDSFRIAQVLLNLVDNAIKFSPESGKIQLSIVGNEKGAGLELKFTISDQGVGIDEEKQRLLFQPFQQADSSTTRQYGGSGLGLVICQRLVELMGGRIWFSSEPDKGSQFYFTVRVGRAEAMDADARGEVLPEALTDFSEPLLRGMTILVVEDNEINQELVCELVEGQGATTALAVNGLEALQRLEEQAFDAVLMDCQMPVMDGYEVTRKIRADARFRDLPIIALTANAYDSDRQRALDTGMNDHIAKPVSPERLYTALVHWVHH